MSKLEESAFLKACHRQPTPYTPVWLMRQAGRYLKEYRTLRKKYSFLEMCRNPELAARVTLQPVERFNLDAAIIFSDILIPLGPMGVRFNFKEKGGPVFQHPVRSKKDVEKLKVFESEEKIPYLTKAIQIVKKELKGNIPLIGFSGAPFTLASYMIEGAGSKDFALTKGLMYRERETWDLLMEKLSEVLIRYLNAQIRAGAQAVQIFDSWAGCLSPSDYTEYVLPYSKKVIDAVDKRVPLIHFAVSSSTLLESMKQAGGDVIGVDWRAEIGEAWKRIGYDTAVQGNLDPVILLGPVELIRKESKRILDRIEGRPGHIFNLGHGVLPDTPPDHVAFLVDWIHEYSSARRKFK